MNNYYLETIELIKKLINDSKIEEALQILEDELNAPYIPRDYEFEFKQLLTSIIDVKRTKEQKILNDPWSKEKVIDVLSKNGDHELHIVAIGKIKDLNARSFTDFFVGYFSNKENLWMSKMYALLTFANQGIDMDFKIVDNLKEVVLNPSKINTKEYDNSFAKLKSNLEKSAGSNDIMLTNFSNQLLTEYYFINFPNKIDDNNINDIVLFILNSCNKMFNIKNFSELKNKELEKQLEKEFKNAGIL
ncbi:hypothetical protein STIUS_v1c03040 [Spiroplasma sp. TIUS-1]|uniref:DUF3196 family protein n=1 Tax=Spiroplasma sp. TIUS-1 TaxID=216963 RepID=UPI001398F0FA|nr:DUF3196 family protein [Spiroplasma sp. TIUS-1]QHX35858.1 hypothetical protein STIUS_v1c03040 [Spiroplasma sp. TIUS-1]